MLLPLLLLACHSPGGDTGSGGPGDGSSDLPPLEHCGAVGDESWGAEREHLLSCDVEVQGELEVQAGTTVWFEPGTALRVRGGSLLVRGESTAPVLFESASEIPLAGDYAGVVLEEGRVELSWLTLRHGGSEGALFEQLGGSARIEDCSFSNSPDHGLLLEGGELEALHRVSVAYAGIPLQLPWSAAAAVSEPSFEEVGTEAIVLSGTPAGELSLPAQPVPYLAPAVELGDGTSLEVEGGAELALGGELEVGEGASLAVWGEADGEPAALSAWNGEVTVRAVEGAGLQFRYARLESVAVESSVGELVFRDSELAGVEGTALRVRGGVASGDPDYLSGNRFEGPGYGLVVDAALLGQVGSNDYEGSAFEGLVVEGGELPTGLSLGSLPSEQVLVRGELSCQGCELELSGGNLLFDGGSFRVEDGALRASGVSFLGLAGTPGSWEGLVLGEGSGESELEGCTLAWGGGGGGEEAANLRLGAPATVRGCTLRGSAGWGIWVEEGVEPVIEDNTYEDNALGDVGQAGEEG